VLGGFYIALQQQQTGSNAQTEVRVCCCVKAKVEDMVRTKRITRGPAPGNDE